MLPQGLKAESKDQEQNEGKMGREGEREYYYILLIISMNYSESANDES